MTRSSILRILVWNLAFAAVASTALAQAVLPFNFGTARRSLFNPGWACTQGVAVGDFNGDGLSDIATSEHWSCDNVTTIQVGYNGPAGTFTRTAITVLDTPKRTAYLLAHNFNADAYTDLVVVGDEVTILLGSASGLGSRANFRTATGESVGMIFAVSVGRFNGDSLDDLMLATGTGMRMLPGTGVGTFGPEVVIDNTPSVGVVTGDFNGDGFQEFARTHHETLNAEVFEANGTGGFTFRKTINPEEWPTGYVDSWSNISSVDLNGDSRSDLVYTTRFHPATGATADLVTVFGNATIANMTGTRHTVPAVGRLWDNKIGDFNGDGDADILFNYYCACPGRFLWAMAGHGDGTFEAPQLLGPTLVGESSYGHQMIIGQFDGVSGLDVAFTQGPQDIFMVVADGNVAPTASNVTITGLARVGETLTGSYTYSDVDNDPQGTSTFRWLRGGTPITGATASTYVVVADDVNTLITFEVTPVASAGTLTGSPVTSAAVIPAPIVTMSATPTALRFMRRLIPGQPEVLGGPQSVTLSFTPSVSSNWTATTDQPWLQIAPSSGSGPALLTVSLNNPGATIGTAPTAAATITITSPQRIGSPVTIAVELTTKTSSGAPFGQVDTPVQYATGLQGAVAISGWALDDIGIASVKIYRNCLPGLDLAGNCQLIDGRHVVFIGDADIVEHARPDVEAAFPTLPDAHEAGWGYLLMSNAYPHVPTGLSTGGQGTFHLFAIATDFEGNRRFLGRGNADESPTTMSLDNDNIAKPFGTLDTPLPGSIVGGAIPIFGWALTPDANTTAGPGDILVPTTGNPVQVFVDGVNRGAVTYGQCRGTVGNPPPSGVFCNDDIANMFGNAVAQAPGTTRTINPTRFRNLDVERGAIGSFVLNTFALANGTHHITMVVTDSAARTESLGGRYFQVFNGAIDLLPVEEAAARPQARRSVLGRTGFDTTLPFEHIPSDDDGLHHVRVAQQARIELSLGAVDAGYHIVNGTRQPLPLGSMLNTATGTFTWALGPAFLGTYRLAFDTDGYERVVEVTVGGAGSEAGVRMHIDAPTDGAVVAGALRVTGWALDPGATFGSGVGTVHVWAQRRDQPGTYAQFLGAAAIGGRRTDVAAAFGRQFSGAGFDLTSSDLDAGVYDVTAFVWSTRTNRWEDARTVRVTITRR